jgi:long-chain acyl-CoA synthetase
VNLATIIDPHPDDAPALVAHGRTVTYGELRRDVAALRGGLAGLGVADGDRVALVCGNGSHFAVGYFATIGLGAICVPLNPASPPPELANQLAHVEAKALLVGPGAGASWAGVDRADVPSVEIVVSAEPADDAHAWDEVAEHEPLDTVELDPDHLAALLFTSGTAGRPQAAMLSHGNLRSNIDQSLSNPDRMRPDDVVFGVLPLFHIFGLNVALGITLAAGASVVLVQRFDPSTALDTIAERGVTILPGAPPMWLAWAAMEGVDPAAFANVRQCLTGASKMPEAAARLLAERFGVALREGYGLTECSPVVTSSASITPKVGSIGVPIEGVEVRLVDPEGDDVLDGDAGEVWVRGPNVFQGYWNDPVTTARVLDADGWVHTGDIAVTDEDGYLYLVDRAKDLIIVSGFNVYPAEVEDVIALLPGVSEVAVVGVPHPHSGEAVKAYVVLDPGIGLTEEQVIGWCADHLARYKCPGKVLFVDELPRGTGGKILRRVLR